MLRARSADEIAPSPPRATLSMGRLLPLLPSLHGPLLPLPTPPSLPPPFFSPFLPFTLLSGSFFLSFLLLYLYFLSDTLLNICSQYTKPPRHSLHTSKIQYVPMK
ncbi:uncharacterized protein LACBIDRAFT_306306 [Laccaria bicolor S238N-H82]|uniref:Predicted protein n=1 Tax=Laccaria bicolor (strain S238N-H82 / ATCC MYA-4686) TaxID=486041 RepID=B0DN31_LACBS|nr:uncharacterized protein LACBIDRAFT_306306 [Laccaria bicolor S238N-H82]EDR04075.1 predicted protein [Laccaria bicolor S238N-H82]|eukprot:XP_001885330.1 predicted protein [Laccaria bicolor S238N-H82]